MVLISREAQVGAPVRADGPHLGRGLPKDDLPAVRGTPVEGLGPVCRAGQDTGRVLPTPPPPRAQPQVCTTAPRTPVSPALTSSRPGGDVLCAYKATWSDVCLETFSVPSGPSFHANTRAIQPGLHPQAIGSQWDHSCPENHARTRVVPLAAAGADTAARFQPNLHVFHLP